MPFFEELEPEAPAGPPPPQYLAFPFQPPQNALPGPLPWVLEVARTTDTVLIVSGFAVFATGFEYQLNGWLRPGSEPAIEPYGLGPAGPRTGWLLDGVTKIGSRPEHGPVGEDPFAPGDPERPRLVGGSGSSGGIQLSASGWVYPLPLGTTLELVVAWPERGIPETFTPIDLAELRSAAARSDVLWELPPPQTDESGGFGWFAYHPHHG